MRQDDIPAEAHWALSDAIKHYNELTESKLKTTIQRWSVVTRSGKRGASLIDIKETLKRLQSRLSKFSIIVRSAGSKNSLNVQAVTFFEGEFRVSSYYVGFEKTMMQRLYALDFVPTERVITKHAILRWLARNQSTDVSEALHVLGKAVSDTDTQIGLKTLAESLKPSGYTERQVECKDGGIAFLVINNPEEDRYRYMQWALVTYISKDMIKHWNTAAIESEYPNLQTMTYQDFLISGLGLGEIEAIRQCARKL